MPVNQTGAAQPIPLQRRTHLYWYLAPIVALPILLLVCAFFVIPTRWFALRSGNTYLANLGYGTTLHDRDCQVLLYGDSSAMVGLDPALIQQQTGLTTCNIAEFEGMTLVSHMLILDTFLRNNPRPRFVVFLYTPEDLFLPEDWAKSNVGTFEAITFQVQFAHNLNTVLLLASHPSAALGWAELGLRMLVLEQFHPVIVSPAAAHLRETTNGMLPIAADTQAQCDDGLRNFPPDPAWLNTLRSRYGADGTTVLIDATPTVACDLSLPFFQQQLNGLIDNTPYQPIPISLYSSDGRLHANRQGVQFLSTLIANQIMGRLNQAPKATIANGIGER